MNHIFLTGERCVGKSFLLSRLFADIGGVEYGFFTKKEEPDKNGVERVYIHPAKGERLYSTENLAAEFGGNRSGQSHFIRAEVFETLGCRFLSDIPPGSTLVMDELGFLENKAIKFREKVLEILDGDYFVLGVVKKRETEFLDKIRAHVRVQLFEVNETNRDSLYLEISGKLRDTLDIFR